MEALIQRLKQVIIDGLHLEDMGIAEIKDDAPLFGADGLDLDSIDALELVLEVERNFQVSIQDNEEGRKVLASVRTLAEYIHAQQNP